jgi:hypothetical protein
MAYSPRTGLLYIPATPERRANASRVSYLSLSVEGCTFG